MSNKLEISIACKRNKRQVNFKLKIFIILSLWQIIDSQNIEQDTKLNDTFHKCKMIEDKCAKRVLLGRLAKGLSDLLLVVRVHQYG